MNRKTTNSIIVGAFVATVAATVMACSTATPATTAGSASPVPTAAQTAPAPAPSPPAPVPTPEPAPVPTGPATQFGPGTHVVGVDIASGTYRTDGPGADDPIQLCYWARLSGTSGDFKEIITNGNTPGPATVTIKAKDRAFETTCQSWHKIG